MKDQEELGLRIARLLDEGADSLGPEQRERLNARAGWRSPGTAGANAGVVPAGRGGRR